MIGISVIVFLIGLFMFAMSRVRYFRSNTTKFFDNTMRSIFGEHLFTTLTFSSCQVAFCLGVMIRYFGDPSIYMYVSFVAAGLFIGLIILNLIFFWIKSHDYFREFKTYFKDADKQ